MLSHKNESGAHVIGGLRKYSWPNRILDIVSKKPSWIWSNLQNLNISKLPSILRRMNNAPKCLSVWRKGQIHPAVPLGCANFPVVTVSCVTVWTIQVNYLYWLKQTKCMIKYFLEQQHFKFPPSLKFEEVFIMWIKEEKQGHCKVPIHQSTNFLHMFCSCIIQAQLWVFPLVQGCQT